MKTISVRSTEIETFDRCSIIVPNSELISSTVQNWTHRDTTVRLVVPIGVSYESDPARVEEVLKAGVREIPEILSYPEPYIYFAGFGDNSLDFEVRVFVGNADKALSTRSKVRTAIFNALKNADIEIPFPQRDLHIKNLPEHLPPSFVS